MKKLTSTVIAVALVMAGTLAGVQAGHDCASEPPGHSHANAAPAPEGAPGFHPTMTQAQQKKLVDYLATKIIERGVVAFEAAEIVEATGTPIEELDVIDAPALQNAVIAELTRRNFDVTSLAGAGHCASFSACSIEHNLSGASGEELALYQAEKAQDGKPFGDVIAPGFTLPATDGTKVSLDDYKGKKIALAFLSGHCNHSLQTLHMLREITSGELPDDLVVLPIYVNSGSVEDVRAWSDSLELKVPLLVDEGREIAEKYDFRMVPSVFLVDGKGRIVKKLVGQKDKESLKAAFEELAGDSDLVARK